MDIEKEEKIIEKQKEDTQENKEKLWKIIAVVLSVFFIILLIVWASKSEEFRLVPFLALLGVILLIFVGLFWGVGWYRKMQELQEGKAMEGKLPPAITIEQAKVLIREQLQSPEYADYVLGWKNSKMYNAGKDGRTKILLVQLDTTYNTAPYQFYIMNLHDPKNMFSYISQEKYNSGELTRAINSLAYSPEEEPNTTVIEEENALTGTKRRVLETHKQEKREEKKGGDFE